MDERYIEVILPLKLDWNPVYKTSDPRIVVGSRVRVRFSGRDYTAVVSAVNVSPGNTEPGKIREIVAADDSFMPSGKEEIEFWKVVADYYLCTVGEVFKAAYPSMKIDNDEARKRREERLRASIEKCERMLSRARKDETRKRYAARIELLKGRQPVYDSSFDEVQLTPSQKRALTEIEAAEEGTVLLNGVTGSGKTEIYLELARRTLERGKNVLYLVPEIALSRQLEERISERFPDVLVFHSGLTAAKKRDVPTEVRLRERYVVLGTRSALFLPHHELGLVIVDEEFDSSYKQDSPSPRYHGRETAIMLSKVHGAKAVLGSATPSLESLYNCSVGRFREVRLSERFYSGATTEVLLVDTAAERKKRGMRGDLSQKLIQKMRETLEKGGQVMLLRARRSYAPAVQCEECGDIPKCPDCNVTLTLHKTFMDRLVCHYCGHAEPFTGTCRKCGGHLVPIGAGTQRIEEEVRELFPEATVSRLDGDTPEKEARGIIHEFEAGKIQILIGTQILTKGFDFGGVALVGVIEADSLLAQQDFRADERAIQLLEQFRGRSSRRGRGGILMIQTREPGHPVFRALSTGIMPDLLSERRQAGFPPYTRELRIVIKDSSERRLEAMSRDLARALEVPLTGPYAPVNERIGGEHFRHIRIMLLRDRNLTPLKRKIAAAVSSFEKDRRYTGHIHIDVDPI